MLQIVILDPLKVFGSGTVIYSNSDLYYPTVIPEGLVYELRSCKLSIINVAAQRANLAVHRSGTVIGLTPPT